MSQAQWNIKSEGWLDQIDVLQSSSVLSISTRVSGRVLQSGTIKSRDVLRWLGAWSSRLRVEKSHHLYTLFSICLRKSATAVF
jgi:hypothetical protein